MFSFLKDKLNILMGLSVLLIFLFIFAPKIGIETIFKVHSEWYGYLMMAITCFLGGLYNLRAVKRGYKKGMNFAYLITFWFGCVFLGVLSTARIIIDFLSAK
jgi:hypothetical protein